MGQYIKEELNVFSKMVKIFALAIFVSVSIIAVAQSSKASVGHVNSSYDELNPVLSPDGLTLYFTVANHPQNVGGKRDPGDIWFSKWEGTEWSAPVHGGTMINDVAFNGVAGISGDGKTMILLSHYEQSARARTQGISVSYNNNGDWSRPRNISIPYFQNKSSIVSGSLSSDLRVFVFSAETYGSYGVEDIYVSFQDVSGNWSAPKNLGQKVNTQFQEVCPSLSTDGKILYFSTNGRKGLGSFDVYAAERLDDSWTNWSEPSNIGSQVNSDGRELYYKAYHSMGLLLFASTKNSDGYGDIRMIEIPEITPTVKPVDTIAFVVREKEPVVPENKIKVFGKVSDSKSLAGIKARVTFVTDEEITPVLADAESGYSTLLESTLTYTIRIEAPGHISTLEKLDMNTYELRSLEMNFKLQPVERGTTVNLKNVLFEQSTTNLLAESKEELNMVVTFMQENPTVSIELSGHTDNRGIHADNVKLSQQRAAKVKDYLVSMGIDAKRISEKGYGGVKPIASNDNEETRKLNRRVEFTIKKM